VTWFLKNTLAIEALLDALRRRPQAERLKVGIRAVSRCVICARRAWFLYAYNFTC